MSAAPALSPEQLNRIRAVASVLLPGSSDTPAADAVPDFDELVQQAATALAGEGRSLAEAIDALPAELTQDSLSAVATSDATTFDQVSLLAVGAYFMSPTVLASLGLPTGERRPANREQVVDELDSGILDAVLERGCPVRTLEEVDQRSGS
jgi:hypothetical protein